VSDPTSKASASEEPDRVVIRDKRKIDPVTGEPRAATPSPDASAPVADATRESAEVSALQDALAERTSDLQRVQAEYANYRKRADRERLAASDVGISTLLAQLLPVLDDIDRARAHGDVSGPFDAIIGKLTDVLDKVGLQPFGDEGDPFDPNIHEAVLHTESSDVTEPTCTTVMRRGYKHNERLLRPAMVGVSDPAEQPGPDASTETFDDDVDVD